MMAHPFGWEQEVFQLPVDKRSTAANAGLAMDVIAAKRPLRCRREQPGEMLVTSLSSFPDTGCLKLADLPKRS